MYHVGVLAGRIGRSARTLSWLGIPLLAGGVVLTALWVIPVAAPIVHVWWADETDAAQRTAFERQRSLVNGALREDGSWAYRLEDASRANVAQIVQAPIIDDTDGIDPTRFEVVGPAFVRPLLGLAPLQSFLGFGLGVLLLVGSMAATRRRRMVYAAVALALLLVAMVTALLPLLVTDDLRNWMGDYEQFAGSRAAFENFSGYRSIPFPHHLTALVLKSLDAALGATAELPTGAFRWLSALAGGLFVAELLGIAMLKRWSAGALRYLALCVAAPVTLLFFGFREIGYLSLSAAGIPLLLRGFSGVGHQSTVIAAALVMGLRSALHGFGLLSLAGGALSALVSVGTLRNQLTRAVVFGVWATAAWLGWLGWYLVGLKVPVAPGSATDIHLRSFATPYVSGHRLVEPILSASGIGDIVASAVVVGVPVLLLGLLSRSGVPRERRLALMFALPSLAFLVVWWPALGVDTEMDLIFATFPAFFAGAWLCARTRAATVAGLALAALAHAGFWFVVQSGDFAEHRAPVIHVRWVETLEEAQRATLERALGLHGAEHRAGSTWSYRVPDVSPDRVDPIIAHDLVDDTYGFHPASDARFGPLIHVRWVETVGNAQRTALERALGLYRAEHSEGTTWRYRVPDASPQRLLEIVVHALVEDTNGFDRATLELDVPAGQIPRLTDPPVPIICETTSLLSLV